MPVSLTQPSEGSVGWAAAVNQNFQDIQTAVNSAGSFLDNVFRVQDDSDPTKQVALDVSGVTTATTRTLTVPNSSGTIALTSQLPAGAALTKTDDTNVTLSLGGSPSTSLLNAASLNVGWSGTLAASRGGTGAASLSAGLDAAFSSTHGTVLYRGASGWAALAPGTSGHFLKTSGASANPSWAAAGALTVLDKQQQTTGTSLTFTVPGDTLAADEDEIWFTFTGVKGSGGSPVESLVYGGSTLISTVTLSSGATATGLGFIRRTGASSQVFGVWWVLSSSGDCKSATGTLALSNGSDQSLVSTFSGNSPAGKATSLAVYKVLA